MFNIQKATRKQKSESKKRKFKDAVFILSNFILQQFVYYPRV